MSIHPTNLAILRHVALYRVTLKETIQKIFFTKGKGPEAGTILTKLSKSDQPSLRAHQRGLGRQVVYYSLTKKGAKEAGTSPERADKFQGEALRNHLAAMWLCCMGAKRYFRLEQEELDGLLGAKGIVHPNTAHCVTSDKDGPRVYRIYPSSSGTKKTISYLKELLEGIRTNPEKKVLRQWIENRDYGFVVLGPTPEACNDLNQAITAADSDLNGRAHFIVRLGPSPETIRDALTNYRDGLA